MKSKCLGNEIPTIKCAISITVSHSDSYFFESKFCVYSFDNLCCITLVCVCVCVCKSLSHVQLFVTHGLEPTRLLCPWYFPSQENWNGLPCPSPGDLPNLGIEPKSPALQTHFTKWATRELTMNRGAIKAKGYFFSKETAVSYLV